MVIYVEPRKHHRRRVSSNTARSQLLLNSQPLPWSAWAAEFSKKMPAELRRLVADEGAARQPDHSLAVQRRLENIMDLFKPRRYRLNAKGKDQANAGAGSPKAAKSKSKAAAKKTKKAAQKAGTKRNNQQAADAGKPADKSLDQENPLPRTVWISGEDGTRAPGFLEDRAAAYLPEQNLLQINRDFSVFADTIAYCGRELQLTRARRRSSGTRFTPGMSRPLWKACWACVPCATPRNGRIATSKRPYPARR